MALLTLSASPAKAGAQLACLQLAGASINYFGLPNRAPAFAGEGNYQ
jgi:hypothetical protein